MKATFKVTPKTTKAQLLQVLTANAQNTEGVDKKTLETAAYAVKNPDKATRSDLSNLVKSFIAALGDKLIVPAFAEGKPETENPKAPETEKKPESESKDEEPKKPEKGADEGGSKKSNKKTVLPRKTIMADVFPETITLGKDTFTLDHEVKTIADLADKHKEFEFAFFWEKRHLKQFPYLWHLSPKNPDEFPDNLDLAQLFYVSDKGTVAYCVSDYTEGLYTVYPRDLEEFEGMRYCNGIEFQIYSRLADPETTTDDEDTDENAENKAE